MFKSLSLFITLGLIAMTSAEHVSLKTLLHKFSHPNLQGTVTWGTCPCDGGFKVDLAKTHSDPLSPKKGDKVQLILSGVWTNDVELDAVKVYVEWNKTPLYVEEFSRTTSYSEGDSYNDNIGWLIPSFAPTGHYAVKITLHDKGTIKNFGCLTADFDL